MFDLQGIFKFIKEILQTPCKMFLIWFFYFTRNLLFSSIKNIEITWELKSMNENKWEIISNDKTTQTTMTKHR